MTSGEHRNRSWSTQGFIIGFNPPSWSIYMQNMITYGVQINCGAQSVDNVSSDRRTNQRTSVNCLFCLFSKDTCTLIERCQHIQYTPLWTQSSLETADRRRDRRLIFNLIYMGSNALWIPPLRCFQYTSLSSLNTVDIV